MKQCGTTFKHALAIWGTDFAKEDVLQLIIITQCPLKYSPSPMCHAVETQEYCTAVLASHEFLPALHCDNCVLTCGVVVIHPRLRLWLHDDCSYSPHAHCRDVRSLLVCCRRKCERKWTRLVAHPCTMRRHRHSPKVSSFSCVLSRVAVRPRCV